MATTFDPTLATLRDKVRNRLGDTGPTDAQPLRPFYLRDETYDALLAAYGYDEAVAQLAEALASHFATLADDVKQGEDSVSYRNRASRFMAQAAALRKIIPVEPRTSDPLAGTAQMTAPDLCHYITD